MESNKNVKSKGVQHKFYKKLSASHIGKTMKPSRWPWVSKRGKCQPRSFSKRDVINDSGLRMPGRSTCVIKGFKRLCGCGFMWLGFFFFFHNIATLFRLPHSRVMLAKSFLLMFPLSPPGRGRRERYRSGPMNLSFIFWLKLYRSHFIHCLDSAHKFNLNKNE